MRKKAKDDGHANRHTVSDLAVHQGSIMFKDISIDLDAEVDRSRMDRHDLGTPVQAFRGQRITSTVFFQVWYTPIKDPFLLDAQHADDGAPFQGLIDRADPSQVQKWISGVRKKLIRRTDRDLCTKTSADIDL